MPARNYSHIVIFLFVVLLFLVIPILVLICAIYRCRYFSDSTSDHCINSQVMFAGCVMGLIPGAIVFAYAYFKWLRYGTLNAEKKDQGKSEESTEIIPIGIEQLAQERLNESRHDERVVFSYLAILLVVSCWACFAICWSGLLDFSTAPLAKKNLQVSNENGNPTDPNASPNPKPETDNEVLEKQRKYRAKIALQLASVGAYVYVIFLLGRRNFQLDITSGSVLWCCTTLAVGPLLALMLAHVCIQNDKPSISFPLISPIILSFGLSDELFLYFIAGLAPRSIIGMLFEVVRRIIIAVTGKNPPEMRVVPLQQIRGVTPDVEERLLEEGITDVANLATADPFRLIRNTSFDKRQILTWIDEALLIYTFPQHWQSLENEGITGARDLAWYIDKGDAIIAELATQIHFDAERLKNAINRLNEHPQVLLLRALFKIEKRLKNE